MQRQSSVNRSSSTAVMKKNLDNNNSNSTITLLSEYETIQKIKSLYDYAKLHKQFDQKQFETDLRQILLQGNKSFSSLSVANLWGAIQYCNYEQNSFRSLPAGILKNLLSITENVFEKCNDVKTISRIFASINSVINFGDDSSPYILLKKILSSLSKNSADLKRKEILLVMPSFLQLCNAINYQAQMRDEQQFWMPLSCGLLSAVENNVHEFDHNEILDILFIYKDMYEHWGSLPDQNYNNKLFLRISDLVCYMSAEQVAKVLQSIAHLYKDWSDLPSKKLANALIAALVDKIEDMSQKSLAKSLWVLAKLNVSLESVDPELRDLIVSSIAKKLASLRLSDLSIACWAVSVLGIKWNEIDPKNLLLPIIKKNIEDDLDQFDPKALIQLQQANVCFNWNLNLATISEIENRGYKELKAKESKWEAAVTARIKTLLENTSIEVESEKIVLFKPVDLYFPEYNAILEFDSDEVHYDQQGELRKKDVLNENAFKRQGFEFERIRQSELKSEDKKKNGDNFILQKLTALKVITLNDNQKYSAAPKKIEQQEDNNNSAIPFVETKVKKKKRNKNKKKIIQEETMIVEQVSVSSSSSSDENSEQMQMDDDTFQTVGKNNKIVRDQKQGTQASFSKSSMFKVLSVAGVVMSAAATIYTKTNK